MWRSVKQSCIVDSTMEAEYVAACEADKEVVWLRKFLSDLEVVSDLDKPVTLYCDNGDVMVNSKEPRSHKRGNHIEWKYYLFREIVQRRDIQRARLCEKVSGSSLAAPVAPSGWNGAEPT